MNSKQRILAKLKEMNVTYSDEIRAVIIPGKDPDRVHKGYQDYPRDWIAQYRMLHMDGKTCKDCVYCRSCTTVWGSKETDTSCQWYPSRVYYKEDI